jgi:hypothetical protein
MLFENSDESQDSVSLVAYMMDILLCYEVLHADMVRVPSSDAAPRDASMFGDVRAQSAPTATSLTATAPRNGAVGQQQQQWRMVRGIKDVRTLARAINSVGRDRYGKRSWLSYSANTVCALERVRAGLVLNFAAAPEMTSLLDALSSMHHVPQLRLFISLQAQSNVSSADRNRRNQLWNVFCERRAEFIANWCNGAPVPEELDDDTIEHHLSVGALRPDDANAERDLGDAVLAALEEFNNDEHGSGDTLRTALIGQHRQPRTCDAAERQQRARGSDPLGRAHG